MDLGGRVLGDLFLFKNQKPIIWGTKIVLEEGFGGLRQIVQI